MDKIKIALGEYGVEAYTGIASNPDVLKYFHEIGYNYINDDDTPWCAAFLNWVLLKCNIKHTNKLNARSFLEIGQATNFPTIGDVVVLWRINPAGSLGHTGLYVRQTEKMIYILGGNEDNSVKIKPYPKEQLLGYRTLN